MFNCKWYFRIGFLHCNIGLEDQWIVAPMRGSILKSSFYLTGDPLTRGKHNSIGTGEDYG